MNFIEELNDIVNLDDTTVYMTDLPLNKNSYPPSCAIDEDFIRELFEGYDFYHDSIIIKKKTRRNGTSYAFAL